MNKLITFMPKLVKPFKSAGSVSEIYKSGYFIFNLAKVCTNLTLLEILAKAAPSISKSSALHLVLVNN